MRPKLYLILAAVAFILATTGSDLVARTFIGGLTIGQAFSEHFRLTWAEAVGTILLFVPFGGVALICAIVQTRARPRGAAVIFAVAILSLMYFYFQGHQAAEQAMIEERWTAAALSIGLLPFFIGFPVLMVSACAGAIVAIFDRRMSD